MQRCLLVLDMDLLTLGEELDLEPVSYLAARPEQQQRRQRWTRGRGIEPPQLHLRKLQTVIIAKTLDNAITHRAAAASVRWLSLLLLSGDLPIRRIARGKCDRRGRAYQDSQRRNRK